MFKRLAAIGAALTVLAAGATAVRAEDPAPVSADVTRTATGVVVRYRLPAPVQRFAFADHDVIRDLWTVTTPGLALADGVVSGAQPFETFEIELKPDAAEVDRIYAGLSRVNQGFLVYGPGLKGEGADTTLTFAAAHGETGLPEVSAIDGYAYVGPSSQVVADERGAMVAGANVSTDLADPLRASFFGSMAFYQAQLGAALPFKPALVASIDGPGPATFRGDVTDTGVISVRFRGDDAWRGATADVVPFVWHETFHLWNGHGVETLDGEASPWLHEGGAEYASFVGAVSTGGLTEDEGRARLSRRVDGCRRLLGNKAFDPAALRSGSGPYNCGTLIQWIVDLEARKAGRGTAFTVWKDLLDVARTGSGGYGVTQFRTRIGADSAVAVLLDGPGETRWDTLKTRLADLGVTIENRPGNNDLMAAALLHVAARNCESGSYGFFNDPGALKLDGDNCGVLSRQPLIATVEGFDPQTDGRATFDAVQARCAETLPIRYQTRDGRTIEAVCDAPLATPVVWWIAAAPPLAIPG
ncbi:hypothetical protein BH09PSE1_BH09PSE1_24280 [soil metagenome]